MLKRIIVHVNILEKKKAISSTHHDQLEAITAKRSKAGKQRDSTSSILTENLNE